MTNLNEMIRKNLPTGFKLVACESHKASTYFYITNPAGIQLVARTSDHEAIASASKSHVQVICDTCLNLDFDFEVKYDEDDYEIELTEEEAAKQLTEHFEIEITEDMIWEADEYNCKLDWREMSGELLDFITAKYITEKIPLVEATNLY